ncbi:MAG: AsmA family protein, partial [Alphaproteobacteria bacterium]|nr:AsmA family protein [Alphaproteobacteria bacterium]
LDGYLPEDGTGDSHAVQVVPKKGQQSKMPESPLAFLETFDSNINLNVGELTFNATPVRGLSVELGLAGGKLNVHRASVRDLAGANLSISGNGAGFAGNPNGQMKFRLRAKLIDGLARLCGIELPLPSKRLKGLTLDGKIKGNAHGVTFNLQSSLTGLKANISGKATGLPDKAIIDAILDLRHGSLASLSRTFDLGIQPLAQSDTPLVFRGTIKGDAAALNVNLRADIAGGEVRITGAVMDLDEMPGMTLNVDAAHKDLVALMASLGKKFPAGQKSPGPVSLVSKIMGGSNHYVLSGLRGKFGNLELSGTAGVSLAGPRPKLTATLQAGEIIANHFLGAAENNGNKSAGSGISNRNRVPERRDSRWSREKINLATLQTFDADINLSAKRLIFQHYPFETPRLRLRVSEGILRVEELTGWLFQGNVGLDATLNSQPLPALNLSLELKGADVNQAMRTALKLDQVTGRLDFSGQFQTSGSSQWDLVNALSGKVSLHATDGVIRGFDMKSFSQRLGKLNKAPDILNLAQRAFSGGQTNYQSIVGNWVIRNGVAETRETLAQLDAAQATMKGKVRLPSWNLDLRTVLRLTEHRDAPDMGVHLFGPLDQPQRDLKTAQLERWLLGRLGRELLGRSSKTKGLGKLLETVIGVGKRTGSQQPQRVPSGTQSSIPQPSKPGQNKPQRQTDPTQKLIERLFKTLRK